MDFKNNVFLKKNNHFEKVSLEEIQFIEASNNYVIVHTSLGKYIYSVVLKRIELLLPRNQFMRVHRSYVVNLNAIKGFEGNLLMVNEKRIPVSKPYRKKIFSLFQVL